jgi:predicted nuclease with TOPRIM domain
MPTVAERVSVVEVQVINLADKISEVKDDIKDMHDCLDNTRDVVTAKLEEMQGEYRSNSTKFFAHADKLHAEDAQAHKMLAAKVEEIEKFKNKWMYLALGAAAALGWMGHVDFGVITKLFGA